MSASTTIDTTQQK